MSEVDDAVQAIDEIREKMDALASLGDIAAQLNVFKDKLNAVGDLGDTAQKINQLQENLKLEDKLKEVFEKLKSLSTEFSHEKWMAFSSGLLTLLEVGKGVCELVSIGETQANINAEIAATNDEAQATFQAMDGLSANLQTTSQLGDLAGQITDLKGRLDSLNGLGDVASQLSSLKEKLDAAEEKLKAIAA